MECNARFYFTKERLENTPSRKDGVHTHHEIRYRREAAKFTQDLGEILKISQLCINTAIVYWKRFYMFHSMRKFLKYKIAAAALFLASKAENQPVKMERLLHHYFKLLFPNVNADLNSVEFQKEVDELLFNESLLLMTLGFELKVEHPHLHIAKNSSTIQARKDVMKLAYFTASKSLLVTSLCLEYKPTIVACFSIHLAALKFQLIIPNNEKNEPWFSCIDKSITHHILNKLTNQYFQEFENHEPWSSVADKMSSAALEFQSPELNLNLSVGISTKQLSFSGDHENMQSPPSEIHHSRSDLHMAENRFKNNQEVGETVDSCKNNEMLQRNLPSTSGIVTCQSTNESSQEISLKRRSYDFDVSFNKRRCISRIDTSQSDHENMQSPPSEIHHSRSDLHMAENRFKNNQEVGETVDSCKNNEMLQRNLPSTSGIVTCQSTNESSQEISLKRRSYDFDVSFNKRRCISRIDTSQRDGGKNRETLIVN